MGPRERRKHSRSKTHTVPIIIASFFGFILLAGIAFGVGMLANVSRWLSDLPNYTDKNQYLVSEPSTILDANGNEIATLYVQNRQNVALDQVSQYVRNGTVATEDERYYEHGGIDLVGIARAVVVQLTGGSEGASTITQQLVRNTILSEEQFDQTIERKVREAWIAIKMEEIFSKDDILEMYLNTIYYGHGAYGIQAAAHTYFSKNCSDLTLAEAALLVGIPNAPSTYDPTVNPDLAKQRRNIVLDRMLSNGCITQEEHDAAQAEDIVLNVTETPENGTLAYPYFVDYVKSVLQEEFSTDMIFKGGLTVKTTIDPTMQAAAEQAVDETYTAQRADELDCGAVAIDPKTGYIKVMYGGRNYNDAAGAHTNHALARRSVGSTFKGITLAAAIKAGMDPSVTLNCSSPMTIKTYSGGTVPIKNAGNHNYGVRTLASATAVSSNTAYVQVQAEDHGVRPGHRHRKRDGGVPRPGQPDPRHLLPHPARDGRGVRNLRERRLPSRCRGHHRGTLARRLPALRAPGQPHPGAHDRPGRSRDQRARDGHQERYRHRRPPFRRPARGRKDRHGVQWRRPDHRCLVRGLHTAAVHRRLVRPLQLERADRLRHDPAPHSHLP